MTETKEEFKREFEKAAAADRAAIEQGGRKKTTKKTSKSKYKLKPFESKGSQYIDSNGTSRKETYVSITESLLTSEAYKDLNYRQRQLYTVCKAQYMGKRKPNKDYPDNFKGDDYFYLNHAAVVSEYGMYSDHMKKAFYDDMKVLESHGFIEKRLQGGYGNRKSVYQYSSEWQSWRAE